MTDARAARVAEKALVQPAPSSLVAKEAAKALVQPLPDARVARTAVKALVRLSPTVQVSRVHAETLLQTTPAAQISRVHAETLLRTTPAAQLSRLSIETLLKYIGADSYDQAVLDLNPVANFKLDETSGTVANTLPPSIWTGTYTNAPTLGVAGRVNGTAVQVATTGSKILQITPPTGSQSCCFWYTYVATASNAAIVGNTGGLSTNRSSLHYANTGNADLVLRLLGDAGQVTLAGVGSTLTNGGWHHLTLVTAASGSTLYVDGVSVGTHASTSNVPTVFNLMRFCELPTNQISNGIVDQVSFFYESLTAPQVATLYAAAPALVVALTGEWVSYG